MEKSLHVLGFSTDENQIYKEPKKYFKIDYDVAYLFTGMLSFQEFHDYLKPKFPPEYTYVTTYLAHLYNKCNKYKIQFIDGKLLQILSDETDKMQIVQYSGIVDKKILFELISTNILLMNQIYFNNLLREKNYKVKDLFLQKSNIQLIDKTKTLFCDEIQCVDSESLRKNLESKVTTVADYILDKNNQNLDKQVEHFGLGVNKTNKDKFVIKVVDLNEIDIFDVDLFVKKETEIIREKITKNIDTGILKSLGIDMKITDEIFDSIVNSTEQLCNENGTYFQGNIKNYNFIVESEKEIIDDKIIFDIDTNLVIINGEVIKFVKFDSITTFKKLIINYYSTLIYLKHIQ